MKHNQLSEAQKYKLEKRKNNSENISKFSHIDTLKSQKIAGQGRLDSLSLLCMDFALRKSRQKLF